jgi:hypothetical protein
VSFDANRTFAHRSADRDTGRRFESTEADHASDLLANAGQSGEIAEKTNNVSLMFVVRHCVSHRRLALATARADCCQVRMLRLQRYKVKDTKI